MSGECPGANWVLGGAPALPFTSTRSCTEAVLTFLHERTLAHLISSHLISNGVDDGPLKTTIISP